VKKTATIILNRNLPKETDSLVEHILEFDGNHTDIFVVEAGSEKNNLSKYCTWHVNTPDVIKQGLRYSRGMNYGLLELWKSGDWSKYDSFFLLTNDTKLAKGQSSINVLQKILEQHPRVGLLSPCSEKWSEKELIGESTLKYFWFIHNNAYFFRKEMLNQLILKDAPTYLNFLFDGDNFRGYLSESEIIARAYANDWAAGITNKVIAEEEESYLLDQNQLIKTESYEENIQLYVEEGLKWAKKKYGFNNRWQMMQYSKLFYDKFFEYFPKERSKKI
jgi:hypothetical protein